MVEMKYWNDPYLHPPAHFTGVEDNRVLGREMSNPRSCERRWYINGLIRKIRSTSGTEYYYAYSYYSYNDMVPKHFSSKDEWFDHLTPEEKEIVIWNWDIWNNNWRTMEE